MNKRQKDIVFGWIAMVILLLLFASFQYDLMENWGALQFPLLIIIAILIALSPTPERSVQLDSGELDDYPWVKIYMALYCLALAYGIYHVLSNQIHLVDHIGPFELFMAVFMLVLPSFMINQARAYKEADDEI